MSNQHAIFTIIPTISNTPLNRTTFLFVNFLTFLPKLFHFLGIIFSFAFLLNLHLASLSACKRNGSPVKVRHISTI